MWRGWRRRGRKHDLLPLVETPAVADLPTPTLESGARYFGTTTSGDWLDRVVARGLGARSSCRLSLSDEGLDVVRLAGSFRIPAAALRGARHDRGIAGKVVPPHGVLVVTWQHGEHLLDTGFRLTDPGDRQHALGPDASKWPSSTTHGSGRSRRWPRRTRHDTTALLVLEDGRTFRGESFGAAGETFGEAVFSTGMSGYQETLTDPSYHRQVVVMTAPHVGNTGMNDEDPESSRIWVSGYVVRDPARRPSSWRSKRSLDDELRDQGVVGISGVDTRALTRHLRERGAMRVGISSTETDPAALLERVLASAGMAGAELATEVSTREAYVVPAVGEKRFTVAAVDLGIKANTPRMMAERGIEVHVLPATSHARGRARDRRRRRVLLQRTGRPGRHRGAGRAAQGGAGGRASPTSGSASATSCSAGRWASAPSS